MMRNHDLPATRLHSEDWKQWFLNAGQLQTTSRGSGKISAFTRRR
jgi:hypothetical protein